MPITPTREVSSANASSHFLGQVRNVELDVCNYIRQSYQLLTGSSTVALSGERVYG